LTSGGILLVVNERRLAMLSDGNRRGGDGIEGHARQGFDG